MTPTCVILHGFFPTYQQMTSTCVKLHGFRGLLYVLKDWRGGGKEGKEVSENGYVYHIFEYLMTRLELKTYTKRHMS